MTKDGELVDFKVERMETGPAMRWVFNDAGEKIAVEVVAPSSGVQFLVSVYGHAKRSFDAQFKGARAFGGSEHQLSWWVRSLAVLLDDRLSAVERKLATTEKNEEV